jgi:hypothetical protein
MENIEDLKFSDPELAIMALRTWAKENGKNRPKKNLKNALKCVGKQALQMNIMA